MSDSILNIFDDDAEDLVTLDEAKRHELLAGIEELGMVEPAASEIGLTLDMVLDAVSMDPRLDVDIKLAIGRYKAGILRRTKELAFYGSKKMVLGGKNRDVDMGYDEIPNDKALELLSKMQFPDELAVVTKQRIRSEVKPITGTQEVEFDWGKLEPADRKTLEGLFFKAKKLVEKKD